jgi:L-alanine-DL-glutamate epimerase-like enolase superfamily enzyme
MKITSVDPFILHVPVTRGGISDSTHRISHWGAPGVIVRTDSELAGYGYTGTHAHLPTDRLIRDCIRDTYGPLLIGRTPDDPAALCDELLHCPPVQWVGRAGITHLALSAIDIALWDLKAKSEGQPLWKLLRGSGSKKIEAYNTDGGWLNWSMEQLVSDCSRLIDEGYPGVKVKVGSGNVLEDCRRVEAVRRAIGGSAKLMVDANGRWRLEEALEFVQRAAECNLYWLEEPLWFDDVQSHAALAANSRIPIALGEQLYTLCHFREFMARGAVRYVQPDAVRLAGVTEWLQVADLAAVYQLPVVPHVGDMAQVHLHLAVAHPACRMLEYIPWMQTCFREPAQVRNGCFLTPELPGAGTTLRPDAFERYAVDSSSPGVPGHSSRK